MTDPRRLLDMGLDDFERDILVAGRADQHSIHAFKRTAAAIGIVSAGSAVTTAVAAGSVSGGGTAGAAKGGISALALLKWGAVGVTAGAATLVGANRLGFVEAPSDPSQTTSARPSSSLLIASRQDNLDVSDVDSGAGIPDAACQSAQCADPTAASMRNTGSAVPVTPSASYYPADASNEWVAPAQAPSNAASPGDTPPTQPVSLDAGKTNLATALASQLPAIDSARRFLRLGDCRRSLDAIAAYLRDYPGGILAPEAYLLQVEALVACGDRAAAHSLAESLLQTNPSAPYAKKLRAAVEGSR